MYQDVFQKNLRHCKSGLFKMSNTFCCSGLLLALMCNHKTSSLESMH